MIRQNPLSACLLVTVLTCVSCSSSQETGKTAVTGSTPAVAALAQPDIEQMVLQNERNVWEAFKAKDAKSVDALLAEEAMIVTSDGRFTKLQFVRLVPRFPEIPSYSIENPKVISPAKAVAILTYESRYVTNEPQPRNHSAYQTTIWVNRG